MQYFAITMPIWSQRAGGLKVDRVGWHNKIDILYKRKDGTRSYPDTYYISGEQARSYPVQQLKNAVRVYVVPIAELKLLSLVLEN